MSVAYTRSRDTTRGNLVCGARQKTYGNRAVQTMPRQKVSSQAAVTAEGMGYFAFAFFARRSSPLTFSPLCLMAAQ